jgi:hypothetical protein
VQTEEELVEIALLKYAHQQAASWGAARFAAEFERRELEERWREAAAANTTPYTRSPENDEDPNHLSGPVDATAQEHVVGLERDAFVLTRPKHARHASVPRPPAQEREPGRKRRRLGRRERSAPQRGWTISPAEAARMSAAGRRLYGIDEASASG